MIALDTNILARFLLNDSESQAEMAEELLHTPCTAPMTVVATLSEKVVVNKGWFGK